MVPAYSFIICVELSLQIVYSSGYVVELSLFSAAFIGIHFPLLVLSEFRPVPQQKSIILLESYVLWWILLIVNTVLINNYGVGGFYFISFFHVASFLTLTITLSEHLLLPKKPELNTNGHHFQHEDTHTETTPLLGRQREVVHPEVLEGEHYGFWLVEYLVMIPFPLLLVTQTCLYLLGSLPQTLADGSPATTGWCFLFSRYYQNIGSPSLSNISVSLACIFELLDGATSGSLRTQGPSLPYSSIPRCIGGHKCL